MPASAHTRKADTPRRKRMFNSVRKNAAQRGLSPGRAIASASAAVKRDYIGNRSPKSRKKKTRA